MKSKEKKNSRQNNLAWNSSFYKLLIIKYYYPHHPQPKLATQRMEKTSVAIKYRSSFAMICPP